MKIADEVTKQDIIMLLCNEAAGKSPGYASVHNIVNRAQGVLESRYGTTLGYSFSKPSMGGVWSDALQEDIEKYDALGGIIETKDDRIAFSVNAEFLLRISGKRNLEMQFGKKLAGEMQSCV